MLNIKTYYYNTDREVVKTNSAADANGAIATAVRHLQVEHYDANIAQVVEMPGSILHAELKMGKDGILRVTYKRDPKSYETRIVV